MSDPFPLLLVPHVVFRDVLKSMDFVNIINLSRCSQKSMKIVRSNMFRLKDWRIATVSNRGIFLQKKYEEERCIWDVSKFDTQIIPTINDGLIQLPKTESDRELKKAIEYVTYLFRSDIHTIRFGNGGTWLMGWVNERGAKASTIIVDEPEEVYLHHGDLEYVLGDSCAGELVLLGFPQRDFEYTGVFGTFDLFYQIRSNWITIEHLISMDCSRVFLPYTSLKSVDLNRFLKHFVNGAVPFLEFTTLGIHRIDEETVLFGLEKYIRRTDNKREYKWNGERHMLIDKSYTFNGLEIVTKNGVRASFEIQIGVNIGTRSEFRMAVWPRS